jgi:hypothetical protein
MPAPPDVASSGVDGGLKDLSNQSIVARVLSFTRLLRLEQHGFIGLSPNRGATKLLKDPLTHGVPQSCYPSSSIC